MGFGFGTTLKNIQRAVRIASSKGIIMISGAGNAGANMLVPYPARDPRVFCIYSTDGYGNRSHFNPPQLSDGRGFSTLGEEAASSWPEKLVRDSGQYEMLKSGSSVAATIASGIAAMVLDSFKCTCTRE
ncbi:hypothetical protein BDZ45DRAFT_676917 [Acephala macrosclerotiorum]|nr:hypothetical protein BDZ45DRAFT_676917 [Acephala macrosclerotiorum]